MDMNKHDMMEEMDQEPMDMKDEEFRKAIEVILEKLATDYNPLKGRSFDEKPKVEAIVTKEENPVMDEEEPIDNKEEYDEESDLIPTEFLRPSKSAMVVIGKGKK